MTIYDDGALPAGYDNSSIDFENWDDYKKKTLQIKHLHGQPETLHHGGVCLRALAL